MTPLHLKSLSGVDAAHRWVGSSMQFPVACGARPHSGRLGWKARSAIEPRILRIPSIPLHSRRGIIISEQKFSIQVQNSLLQSNSFRFAHVWIGEANLVRQHIAWRPILETKTRTG